MNDEKTARAITAPHIGMDATGTHVECLTEAVMGMTAALVQIATSLDWIAEEIREQKR